MARKKRLPGRLLHKASGQSIVVLNGKTHYLGKHDSEEAKDEYEKKIAEWLENGRALPTRTSRKAAEGDEAEITVELVVGEFVVWAKEHYRGTRSYANLKPALRVLNKLYGRTLAADFGPKALKAYRRAWLERPNERNGKPLSRKHVNRQVGIVRRVFKWAVAEELVPADVLLALQAVTDIRTNRAPGENDERERKPVQAVEWERVEAVLPQLSRQIEAMVLLQWWTGMRPGEVTQMRTQDIDRTDEVWIYRPARHKSQHRNKERTIPLGPKAQEVLRPFLRVDQSFLFQPEEAVTEHRDKKREDRKTPLWPSHLDAQKAKRDAATPMEFGKSYTTPAYGRAIGRACKRANVKHWSPNMLRHAAATRLRREIGIEAARVVLGHTSATTTEIYAEADRINARDAMKKSG